MKRSLLVLTLIVFVFLGISAQETQQFMQITTIESVVSAGFGRSKMIITKEDGSQEERDMENLFSMTGMNLENIKSNESSIIQVLKTYTDQGWKLQSAVPLTLSPGQNGNGIFMTRYLLVRSDAKKGF